MNQIYLFSGPCGCGKSTLAAAFAKHLVNECGKKQVYLIHGDDFQGGFVEPEDKGAFFVGGTAGDALAWDRILKFNWDCILSVAAMALEKGLPVVIDYVVEDELPLVEQLAAQSGAQLYYVVLTASEETIRRRIIQRGDTDLLERAVFLKRKLEKMPENQGFLFDNTDKTPEREIAELEMEKFRKQ